jgi:hypothetical protein
VRKSLVKRPEGMTRKKSEANIRMELRGIICEASSGREVAQVRVHQ